MQEQRGIGKLISISDVICLILVMCLFYEAGYGIMQVLGRVPSKHVLFAMTGHFSNPGPFGGFVAMLMAICLSYSVFVNVDSIYRKWIKRVCVAASVLGFIVLPASMSRAAWLSLIVVLCILALKQKKVRDWLKNNSTKQLLLCSILVVTSVGAFLLKRDSALGRLHVWHMEVRAIASSPFVGFGKGSFAFVYGQTQAEYFSSAERALWEVRVAGCPEYAFNEYLKVGMEWGLLSFVLAIVVAVFVCAILIKRNNPLGYGALALSVFACFSYPLSLWQFKLFAGLYLFAAIGNLCGRHAWIAYVSYIVLLCSAGLFPRDRIRKPDFRDLYMQGYTMFQNGRYEQAISVLQEGSEQSCDPMFHNIIGRCYESLGEKEMAEKEYWHAYYMVPGRLYPLVLLQEMYLSQADTANAREMLVLMDRIQMNNKNSNMKVLRKRAENNMLNTKPFLP